LEQSDRFDANEACGVALLAQARPLEPSAARKHRVWNALHASGMKRSIFRLSPAFAIAIVLFGATGASGMVARMWLRSHRPLASAAPPLAPQPAQRPPAIELPAIPHQNIAPATTPPEPLRRPATFSPEAKPAGRLRPPSTAPSADLVRSPGAALMVQAMQARRAADYGRVRELAAEYRSKYPDGALQEEALALSIEAAAARGDADASRLASLYLQAYPTGRFREQALRALRSPLR